MRARILIARASAVFCVIGSCFRILRGFQIGLLVISLALTACSSMPPAVDTELYVPLSLAPVSLTGSRDMRAPFREFFCNEDLNDLEPDRREEACHTALRRFRDEAPLGAGPGKRTDLRTQYRVALALGMGWDCVRGLIDESQLPTARLRDYGIDTLLLEVEGLSSTERNAEIIASALEEQFAGDDQRPFILVGYSKGAPDILEAVARYPEVAAHTAAFVSIAGAVGGSPVVEQTGGGTMAALKYSPYGDCSNGDAQVLRSLHPAERHAWLADHLPLPVPSYSLVTAPEPERVSRALRSSYKLLGTVHPINDGALLHWDQMLPGSTLLGYVNADHWAVTVPIDVDDVPFGEFLLRNGFPRTQLWLAMVDFIIADLAAGSPAQR